MNKISYKSNDKKFISIRKSSAQFATNNWFLCEFYSIISIIVTTTTIWWIAVSLSVVLVDVLPNFRVSHVSGVISAESINTTWIQCKWKEKISVKTLLFGIFLWKYRKNTWCRNWRLHWTHRDWRKRWFWANFWKTRFQLIFLQNSLQVFVRKIFLQDQCIEFDVWNSPASDNNW